MIVLFLRRLGFSDVCVPQDVKFSMKTDERHQRKTNELQKAVAITGGIFGRHATTIVAAVCGVLIVSAATIWWGRQASATGSEAWTLLEAAETVDDFGSVAEKFKNTLPGHWAKLRESELYLRTGSAVLFSDRELAKADLKRSVEGFEKLLSSGNLEGAIRERAAWGIARCLESISDADTGKAIDAYQRLITEFPETIYKVFAEDRVAKLKTGGAKEFYSWFSKQNPQPVETRPRDGIIKGGLDSLLPSSTEADEQSESNTGLIPSVTSDNDAQAKDEPEASPIDAKLTNPPPTTGSIPPESEKDILKSDKPADVKVDE